jgi:hypothetical protein
MGSSINVPSCARWLGPILDMDIGACMRCC